MFLLFDPTMILLFPALLISFWAQFKVQNSFSKYSNVYSSSGMKASEIAKKILSNAGIEDVSIERIHGFLTDHYDPKKKVLRLSQNVFDSESIAAIGVAAHEAGHAIQDKSGYLAMKIRHNIVPFASFGSQLAFPIFFLGLFMGIPSLLKIGILLFVGIVLFHLVTLPVEFDASSKAMRLLKKNNLVNSREMKAVKETLSAAALTYVAATLVAIMQLVRLLILAGRRD